MNSSHLRQYLAAIFSSLSAFCAGCSFVWTTPLLPRLQKPGADVFLSHSDASWVVSLIELGNLISPIPGAFLCDRIGRKPVLLSTAPMYVVTWLLVLFTRNIECLYIMRIIQGMGLGIVYAILPMYLGEIAEPALRGTMSVFFIGMWFLGILSVYCIGPFVSYQDLTWYCLVPPVIYAATFWYFPESPHFYLMRGKNIKAANALMWLRGKSDVSEVQDEMQMMLEAATEASKTEASWKDLFYTRPGRRSLLIVQVVAMAQIMAGFTAILSFATDTFKSSGDTLIDPDISTMIIGGVTLIVTLFSAGMVDRAGRRPILLFSSAGSFVCLSLTAIYFFIIEETSIDTTAWTWVPYASIFAFVGIMNFGLAALLPTLQAELFPNATRGVASGITAVNICIMSFIVLKIYLPVQYSVGLVLNYTMYAGFALLGTLLIYMLLPETKGKTFQEIQELL